MYRNGNPQGAIWDLERLLRHPAQPSWAIACTGHAAAKVATRSAAKFMSLPTLPARGSKAHK